LDAANGVDDYDRKKYRVIFMKVLSALLGVTFAVQVVVALSTGHVSLLRTGRREVFRASKGNATMTSDRGKSRKRESPLFFR